VRRIFVPLALYLSFTLLTVACGGSDQASSNTTANTNKATTTTTTTTSSPSTTNSSTSTTTTSTSGEKIGVPECDDFIAKYEACISGKVPEAARTQYKATLEQWRKSWRDLAANPTTKATLAQACKISAAQAKQTMKSFGCDF
jgi:hypothetical protein